jgi:enoyl-[acyl-carrier-protein] reductase (NADH)
VTLPPSLDLSGRRALVTGVISDMSIDYHTRLE